MLSKRASLLLNILVITLLLLSPFPPASLSVGAVQAANGDFVHKTYFSHPCGFLGVGIAFDGEYLWYSCYATSPDLYKANTLTGQVVVSYTVAGGLGALAWDGKRKMIWAGWGGGAGAEGMVRLFDPATGTTTIPFTATAAINNVNLDDGLAYDAQDDTLFIGADASTTIYHYSVTGQLLGSFAWAGSGCYNSGIAIGGELMFQGSNGCNRVWAVRRGDRAHVFDFSTIVGDDPSFRDEDLECDSVTFAPRTVMWSVEAYEPRRAVAFEIPPGTCATGGGVDSDGDGLLDEWETDGVTIDPDGDGAIPPQFVDLPAMQADKDKPDVFLHIDWMENAEHSHRLNSAAIRRVVEAFANSPYTTTTGSVGINLHVDQGPNSILDFTTGITWGVLSRARAVDHVNLLGSITGDEYDWADFDARKNAANGYTQSGRSPIFHYVLSSHMFDAEGHSGLSRQIPASDFIVSLGSFSGGTGTRLDQAGTLMHELGHNLGLCHGGPVDLAGPQGQCNVNFKPNYLSVMNYSFQLQGLIRDDVAGTFDYSDGVLPVLNENSLNESAGLGPAAAGFGTRHYCNFLFGLAAVWAPELDATQPIDWNCDGDTGDTGVTYDVNGEGGSHQQLVGYNDWQNLKLKGGGIGLAGIEPDFPVTTIVDEQMTPELAMHIMPLPSTTFLPAISR